MIDAVQEVRRASRPWRRPLTFHVTIVSDIDGLHRRRRAPLLGAAVTTTLGPTRPAHRNPPHRRAITGRNPQASHGAGCHCMCRVLGHRLGGRAPVAYPGCSVPKIELPAAARPVGGAEPHRPAPGGGTERAAALALGGADRAQAAGRAPAACRPGGGWCAQRGRREARAREQAAPPTHAPTARPLEGDPAGAATGALDAGNRQAARDLPRHRQQLRPGQRRAWTPDRRRGILRRKRRH